MFRIGILTSETFACVNDAWVCGRPRKWLMNPLWQLHSSSATITSRHSILTNSWAAKKRLWHRVVIGSTPPLWLIDWYLHLFHLYGSAACLIATLKTALRYAAGVKAADCGFLCIQNHCRKTHQGRMLARLGGRCCAAGRNLSPKRFKCCACPPRWKWHFIWRPKNFFQNY